MDSDMEANMTKFGKFWTAYFVLIVAVIVLIVT